MSAAKTRTGSPMLAVFGLPLLVILLLLILWHIAVRMSGSDLFPTPMEVLRGITELARQGLLVRYIVASLFRVSWGFGLAVLVGVPLGLVLGWFRPAFLAMNPVIQILRPFRPSRGFRWRFCGSASRTPRRSSSFFSRVYFPSPCRRWRPCRTCNPFTSGPHKTSG